MICCGTLNLLQKELTKSDHGGLRKRPKHPKRLMVSERKLKRHILDVFSAPRGRLLRTTIKSLKPYDNHSWDFSNGGKKTTTRNDFYQHILYHFYCKIAVVVIRQYWTPPPLSSYVIFVLFNPCYWLF